MSFLLWLTYCLPSPKDNSSANAVCAEHGARQGGSAAGRRAEADGLPDVRDSRHEQPDPLHRFCSSILTRYFILLLLYYKFLFLLHHTYTMVMTFYFCHTTEEVACSDPDKCMAFCNNKSGCTNIAYPLMVLRLLPKGAYAMPYRTSVSILGFFLGEIKLSFTYFKKFSFNVHNTHVHVYICI